MTDRDIITSSATLAAPPPAAPQRDQNNFLPEAGLGHGDSSVTGPPSVSKPSSLSLGEINKPLFKVSNCVVDSNHEGNNNNNNPSQHLHSTFFHHNDDSSLRERFEMMNMNNVGDMKNKFHSADDGREMASSLDTRHQLYNRTTPTTPLSPLLHQQQQHQQQIYQSMQRNMFPSMLQSDQLTDNNSPQQQQHQQHQKHLNQFSPGLLPLPQQQYLSSPYDLSPQDLPFFLNHPNFRFNASAAAAAANINNGINNVPNNNINNVPNNIPNNNINNNFHASSSPKSDEMRSFLKSLRKTNNIGPMINNDGNAYFNDPVLELNNNNNNNNMFDNFKLPNHLDSFDAANIASNSQLSEALIMRLKQQNSLAKQQLSNNFLDLQLAGSNCREILNRHFSLNNIPLVDQEKLARLYICELVKENPNLMTSHLLNNSLLTNLTYPIAGFANGHVESFSRKVFVGGLPPDSDENEITASFRQFGPLIVDWPHKAETKTSFPPKGYCFLLFQDEMSVQKLMEACQEDDGKFYWCIPSTSSKDKPVRRVQIRPWSLIDSDFLMDASQPLDLRKTVFVGGVPRPLKAAELAIAMDQLYGCVCYAGIDTDPELKYPKGAGRVSFSSQQSYISAISARFVQLQFGDIDKRVEVKPYVLDDQLCDECQGQKSAGKSAPYYCANVACLQYYCETCWVQIHSRPGREFHKPLVKEGADRPKSIPPFKW